MINVVLMEALKPITPSQVGSDYKKLATATQDGREKSFTNRKTL